MGLVCRDFGSRPSERLGVKNEVAAFGVDAACSLRLARFDNEKRVADFNALGVMLGGKPDGDQGGHAENW